MVILRPSCAFPKNIRHGRRLRLAHRDFFCAPSRHGRGSGCARVGSACRSLWLRWRCPPCSTPCAGSTCQRLVPCVSRPPSLLQELHARTSPATETPPHVEHSARPLLQAASAVRRWRAWRQSLARPASSRAAAASFAFSDSMAARAAAAHPPALTPPRRRTKPMELTHRPASLCLLCASICLRIPPR